MWKPHEWLLMWDSLPFSYALDGWFDFVKVNGLHQGILRLAMEPSLLGAAVMGGGPDRKIKLDHSPGVDEVIFTVIAWSGISAQSFRYLTNSGRIIYLF